MRLVHPELRLSHDGSAEGHPQLRGEAGRARRGRLGSRALSRSPLAVPRPAPCQTPAESPSVPLQCSRTQRRTRRVFAEFGRGGRRIKLARVFFSPSVFVAARGRGTRVPDVFETTAGALREPAGYRVPSGPSSASLHAAAALLLPFLPEHLGLNIGNEDGCLQCQKGVALFCTFQISRVVVARLTRNRVVSLHLEGVETCSTRNPLGDFVAVAPPEATKLSLGC